MQFRRRLNILMAPVRIYKFPVFPFLKLAKTKET